MGKSRDAEPVENSEKSNNKNTQISNASSLKSPPYESTAPFNSFGPINRSVFLAGHAEMIVHAPSNSQYRFPGVPLERAGRRLGSTTPTQYSGHPDLALKNVPI
jgi:hypothetical protein